MNQRISHTEPNPNSYVAAYGYKYDGFVWFKNMDELMQQDNDEEDLYFYHGDHLGSSSWITDASGNVNQYLAYMPFGESFIDQRSGNDIRFKFTGKERDSETGFDYFGARYYASGLSIWLSVDPMSDKHPDYSPYAYVYNNPFNLVDPWGLDTILVDRRGNIAKKTLKDNVNDFDVIVKVSKKEVKNNKIKYKRNGKLRQRHKKQKLEKDVVNIRRGTLNLKTGSIDYTAIFMSGDNRADQGKVLFGFLEENTNPEWSYTAFVNKGSSDVNILIATSHDDISESYGPTFSKQLANSGMTSIISCLHTHSRGELRSSEADRSYRDNINNLNQNPIFSIMSWGKIRDYNDDK
jgi:RHS repeat-associated protein